MASGRLGAYEITEQIGVGGMGEVYRATFRGHSVAQCRSGRDMIA